MLTIETKAQGAELTHILWQGKEMLHDAKTDWKRHAPILFPIVGQLKNGETTIEGANYKMGQHGFARDMTFTKIIKTDNKHQYVLKANTETLKQYPYLFELYVTYQLTENRLTIQYEVKNVDNKTIYFGIGGHPAFQCDYSSGEYAIEFAQKEDTITFLKLENGLISEQSKKNPLQNNQIKLEKNTFEQDAIIMKNINSHQVSLIHNKDNHKVLEFEFKGFPYLALWSKKGAPFVCIEPWYTTADKVSSNGVFKEKENTISLEPNKIFTCQYQIKFF